MRRSLATTARARLRPQHAVAVTVGLIVVLILAATTFHGTKEAGTTTAPAKVGSPPATSSSDSDPDDPVESAVRYIEELSNLSDSDPSLEGLSHLDLALAASRLIDPTLPDEDSIRDQISSMGDVAREAWHNSTQSNPETRISALSSVIFDTYGFSVPSTDAPLLTGEGVFDTYALPGVLHGKRGYCEGLSTIYLLVAESAGIRGVSLVDLPVHTLIRVDVEGKEDEPMYVETLDGGAIRPYSYVRTMNGVTEEAVAAATAAASSGGGVYLSPLTKLQFLNLHVNALAYGLIMQPSGTHPLSVDQMVRLANVIERLDPQRPESLDTAALIHYEVGDDARVALDIMDRVMVLAERYGAPDSIMEHYREVHDRYEAAAAAAAVVEESDESTRV